VSIRVACLGPEGTVSHEALAIAAASSGIDVEPLLTSTIHHAVAALTAGEADFALVPLENSLEGGVAPTLDEILAREGTTPIVGELLHPVHHRLIAKESISLADITEVMSLPFVAAQCGPWLRENLPDVRITQAHSTADAVKTMSEVGGSTAALGTALAAQLYGCEVIVDEVDEGGNTTRFVWLSNESHGQLPPGVSETPPLKTSIVFWGSGAEEPGWLVECLGEFGGRGVNLTRIESRPRRDELGSYVFFADLEGGSHDAAVSAALDGVAAKADSVILLGSYPAATK
jgi:prephenate dehydratase